ncbi:hypothetical protein ACQ4PT_043006 [Festuca glaucescens]
MASLSSARALLPAAHAGSGIPSAALKAAATSGAFFLVVCPAGDRAKAVLAALHATTRAAGLVLSSRVVARAAKRSGRGVEGGRTGEDPEEVEDVFFVGAGEDGTGEEAANVDTTNTKAANVFFVGAGEDRTGEEDANGDTEPKDVFFGVGDSTHEMTLEELALMFQVETAMLLKSVKLFPMSPDYNDNIPDLIAACDALGDQLRKVDASPEGRTTVHHSLVALHLRIVTCAGGVEDLKVGSYMPDMWVGDRYRLPCKEKRAGTLMELLLYSMMLASAALAPFVSDPKEIDFRNYD